MNPTMRLTEQDLESRDQATAMTCPIDRLHIHAHLPPYLPCPEPGNPCDELRRVGTTMILSGNAASWLESPARYDSSVPRDLLDHVTGAVYLYLGDLTKACEVIQAAIDCRNADQDAYLQASSTSNLSVATLLLGDTAEAWNLATSAWELAPDFPVPHVNRHFIARRASIQPWGDQARRDLDASIPNWKSNDLMDSALRVSSLQFVSMV